MKWDNLACRRYKHELVTMYKIINANSPSYLKDQFTKLCEQNSYNLRERETKVKFPQPKTEQFRNSFRFRAAVKWNSLPDHIRLSKSLEAFKREIASYCLHSQSVI